MADDSVALRRFMQELRHHLRGWREKVQEDFGNTNFQREIDGLASDPVYAKFHLATPEYVFIRLMGRMSVSIGRRLGEIYDKIPRIAAQSRYGLSRQQVIAKFGGLEIDVHIRRSDLNEADKVSLGRVAKQHLGIDLAKYAGLGIEIRYNFNPNDSARLRKDKQLARLLIAEGYYPNYLVFADNSPRLADAVASLERAGWNFLIAHPALDFMAEVVGFNISNVLDQEEVSAEISDEMSLLMRDIWESFAAKQLRHRFSFE